MSKQLSFPRTDLAGIFNKAPGADTTPCILFTIKAGVQAISHAMSMPDSGRPVDGSSWKSTQTENTSKNAQILRDNMEKAGEKFGDDEQAHHIVLGRHERAKPARDILDKYRIDINSADNGVRLPKEIHQGTRLHSNRAIDEINNLLALANSPEDVIAILNKIAKQIKVGAFPP